MPAFLSLPAGGTVTVDHLTRKVVVPAATQAQQIYRFELENGARLTWNVWMAPTGTGAAGIALPNPSSYNDSGSTALVDPFLAALGDDNKTHSSSARILSLKFTDNTKTSDQVESFGALRLDDVGTALSAFTAVQVDIQ
jgi:hypothetical protein